MSALVGMLSSQLKGRSAFGADAALSEEKEKAIGIVATLPEPEEATGSKHVPSRRVPLGS